MKNSPFAQVLISCLFFALVVTPCLQGQDQTITDRQLLKKASVNGKYKNLLHRIEVPGDSGRYGQFTDHSYLERPEWGKYEGMKSGYWVYVAPHWYIWADKHNGEGVPRPPEKATFQPASRVARKTRPRYTLPQFSVPKPELAPEVATAEPEHPSYPESWQEAFRSTSNIALTSRTKLPEREFFAKIRDLVFSPNGQFLAVELDDGTIRIVDLTLGQTTKPVVIRAGAWNMQFTPDSRSIITTDGNGAYRWQVADGQEIVRQRFRWTKPWHRTSVVLSDDGRFAVTHGYKGTRGRSTLVSGPGTTINNLGNEAIRDERLYVYDLHRKAQVSSFVPKEHSAVAELVSGTKQEVFTKGGFAEDKAIFHRWSFTEKDPLDPISKLVVPYPDGVERWVFKARSCIETAKCCWQMFPKASLRQR